MRGQRSGPTLTAADLAAVGWARRSAPPSGRAPPRPLLEEAGPLDEAVELVFAGADRGIQKEIEHDYERSLPIRTRRATRSCSRTR
jgi:hypothetical protein